ncbi:hypothetical protein QUC31_019337 [Theobroma cacao]
MQGLREIRKHATKGWAREYLVFCSVVFSCCFCLGFIVHEMRYSYRPEWA